MSGGMNADTRDTFICRDGDDYAQAFARLLPTGEAWSRDPDGDLMRLVRGQAEIWGAVVDPRAADLLELELDPRFTTEMLPDWERAFGLPDPCVQERYTLEERRLSLIERITAEGGQSRAYFYNVAARLGYVIRIVEYSPFMAGISRCGDTRATGWSGTGRMASGSIEAGSASTLAARPSMGTTIAAAR